MYNINVKEITKDYYILSEDQPAEIRLGADRFNIECNIHSGCKIKESHFVTEDVVVATTEAGEKMYFPVYDNGLLYAVWGSYYERWGGFESYDMALAAYEWLDNDWYTDDEYYEAEKAGMNEDELSYHYSFTFTEYLKRCDIVEHKPISEIANELNCKTMTDCFGNYEVILCSGLNAEQIEDAIKKYHLELVEVTRYSKWASKVQYTELDEALSYNAKYNYIYDVYGTFTDGMSSLDLACEDAEDYIRVKIENMLKYYNLDDEEQKEWYVEYMKKFAQLREVWSKVESPEEYFVHEYYGSEELHIEKRRITEFKDDKRRDVFLAMRYDKYGIVSIKNSTTSKTNKN